MTITFRQSRVVALTTAGVLTSALFLNAAPAHADKSNTLKAGAIGLGALGAYWITKGKTVEGAAAVAGGLYAYKKGQDAKRDEQRDDRYSRYPSSSGSGGYYGGGYQGGYNNGGYYNRGGYTGTNGDRLRHDWDDPTNPVWNNRRDDGGNYRNRGGYNTNYGNDRYNEWNRNDGRNRNVNWRDSNDNCSQNDSNFDRRSRR